MIWHSRSSEVRVKVTWDLKFQKWRFSNSISSAIFQPIKKIPTVSDTRPKYIKNLLGRIFEFPPSYRVTWLQTMPKNRLHPILMKLGVMLEVDETFMTIWLSRSSEVRVKVRRWPQSPLGTIFITVCCSVKSNKLNNEKCTPWLFIKTLRMLPNEKWSWYWQP